MQNFYYYPLTLAELESKLLNAIDKLKISFQECSDIAQVLYETGLRAGEVLNLQLWGNPIGSIVPVQLLKREGIRNITITPAIEKALNIKATTGNTWRDTTYKFFEYHLIQYTGKLITDSNTKCTGSHAYRYLYIHKLAALGWSPEAIQGEIHHRS